MGKSSHRQSVEVCIRKSPAIVGLRILAVLVAIDTVVLVIYIS